MPTEIYRILFQVRVKKKASMSRQDGTELWLLYCKGGINLRNVLGAWANWQLQQCAKSPFDCQVYLSVQLEKNNLSQLLLWLSKTSSSLFCKIQSFPIFPFCFIQDLYSIMHSVPDLVTAGLSPGLQHTCLTLPGSTTHVTFTPLPDRLRCQVPDVAFCLPTDSLTAYSSLNLTL